MLAVPEGHKPLSLEFIALLTGANAIQAKAQASRAVGNFLVTLQDELVSQELLLPSVLQGQGLDSLSFVACGSIYRTFFFTFLQASQAFPVGTPGISFANVVKNAGQ